MDNPFRLHDLFPLDDSGNFLVNVHSIDGSLLTGNDEIAFFSRRVGFEKGRGLKLREFVFACSKFVLHSTVYFLARETRKSRFKEMFHEPS